MLSADKARAGADVSNLVPGAGVTAKRAAGADVDCRTRVACHTAAPAMIAQIIAALQGTSWPPIDGEIARSATGASSRVTACRTGVTSAVETGATKR